MNKRLAASRALARKARCSHLLVSDSVDVEYISGFSSTNAYLLISRKSSILLTDFRYEAAARAFCRKYPSWHFVKTGEDALAALSGLLRRGSRVGIQSDTVSVDRYDRLRKKCAQATFVKLGDNVAHISVEKLGGEIASMQRAARIADRAFKSFLSKIRLNITEKQAARMLDDICGQFGSEGPSFPTIILFGSRSALPHGHPSCKKLKRGELILCDFGCTSAGFCSDMTRMAVAGKASKKQKAIYAVVYQAQEKARKTVRASVPVKHVDAQARDIIAAAGYGSAFGHATGHGVGRRIHEKPRVGQHDRTILQKDMVVTIEPGIYLSRWGGIRIEDMVAVRENGSKCLTRFPRKLVEIGL